MTGDHAANVAAGTGDGDVHEELLGELCRYRIRVAEKGALG